MVWFGPYCDESSFFVPTATAREIGSELAFSIDLVDGTAALEGLGVVLQAWPTTTDGLVRAGMLIEIRRLSATTAPLFERLQRARDGRPDTSTSEKRVSGFDGDVTAPATAAYAGEVARSRVAADPWDLRSGPIEMVEMIDIGPARQSARPSSPRPAPRASRPRRTTQRGTPAPVTTPRPGTPVRAVDDPDDDTKIGGDDESTVRRSVDDGNLPTLTASAELGSPLQDLADVPITPSAAAEESAEDTAVEPPSHARASEPERAVRTLPRLGSRRLRWLGVVGALGVVGVLSFVIIPRVFATAESDAPARDVIMPAARSPSGTTSTKPPPSIAAARRGSAESPPAPVPSAAGSSESPPGPVPSAAGSIESPVAVVPTPSGAAALPTATDATRATPSKKPARSRKRVPVKASTKAKLVPSNTAPCEGLGCI